MYCTVYRGCCAALLDQVARDKAVIPRVIIEFVIKPDAARDSFGLGI